MIESTAHTIAELLHEQAFARPAAPAVLAPGRAALTFADLWLQVSELAQALQSIGVTPATRVAVVLPNGPEMAVVFLGTSMCSTCAPLNPAYTAAELRFYLEDLSAEVVIVRAGEAGLAGAVARELGLAVIEIGSDPAQPAGHLRMALPHITEAATPAAMPGADDIALILHTSGTTARPKIVPLRQANLVASALNIAQHLRLAPDDRCLNVMPLFHIHGLVGALLSTIASGGSIVCTPGFDSQLFFDWTAQFDPTWYSAVPTIHQSVFDHGAQYRLKAPQHQFRFVRSSSAALAPAVFHRLQELTGAPVIEAYGMTEASHQMASNPLPPGVCKPGSVGIATGVDIALMNERGDLLAHGETGEIVIRGPGVFGGYENNPQANASSFTDGWFRTGDQGRIDAEGYLFISGRLKEIVNRGGEKISPREVDEALLEHPDVAQATAFGRPHPVLGEDLAAAVVLRTDAQADEAALRAFLFGRLAAHKVPSIIAVVDVIPKGPTGKVQRNSLHETLRDRLSRAFVDAGNDLERSIQAIFSEVLGGGPLGVHDNFFAAGGDSLMATRVIARLNERHGVALTAPLVFHHPTIATLAATAVAAGASARPAVRPSEPLSPAQEALWFLEQLHGPSGVYNIACALRLVGSLDVAALEHSLQGLLERHDSLRTGFAEQDGVPVQFVQPGAAIRLCALDVSNPADENRLLSEGAFQAFDLSHAPLLRAQLLRRSDTEHVLQLVAHHMVSDGWSTDLMVRELGIRYAARLEGTVPALPPLAFRYAEHVQRQRERLRDEPLARHLQYWRTRLHGLEPLKLPSDQPQPDRISQQGSVATLTVGAELYEALQAMVRAQKSTLFTVLTAAFNVLLARYSAQDDVAVGMPMAGREGPESEGVVGFFVNTVVLRTDLSDNPGFLQLLQRVRHGVLEAREHQDVPFERLVGELGAPRDLGSNPLFDVFINQYSLADAATCFPGLVATEVALEQGRAKFAATLYLQPRPHELTMRLVFRRGLYTEAWGACLLQQYVALLGQIVLAPAKPIREYSLLTDATRSQLPDPSLEIPVPEQIPVMRQVLDRALASPDNIALSCGERQWTYAEVVARASALSSALQSHGVARGDVVAILAPRGPEMVGSMLAVLLCGGVLLTVDPALPRERQRVLLREARVKVLCLAQGIEKPSTGDGDEPMGILRLDSDLGSFALADAHAGVVLPMPSGDEPAYVFFTSGSTGRPKAVLGCHKSLSQFLQWQQQTFEIGPHDRVSQLIALSFDPLLRDVFLPLISGATLCVPTEQDNFDALRWLQKERVTVVHTTPRVLQTWLADLSSPLDLPNLRWLFLSGEPLTGSLVTRWRQCVQSQARTVNLYGPTETTMVRCFHVVPEGDVPAVLPVGRPTTHAQALVMSAAGAPCGANEPGEVVLRTPFRTLGYLNLPEENRARFRRNPFRDDPDDLLYFTGDRGHLRPDGLLMVAGRLDDQVKIRGVRVEPGEVAAVLAQHPGVQACVVTTRKNDLDEFELVAHVVKAALASPTVGQLRDHLKSHLPAALVPALYVFLDALPLLPNGKVDRKALPPPEKAQDTLRTAPRTPLEQTLADIWRELLGTSQVGVDDDFFDLGGHSLLAMRVISRIQSTLPVRITVRALFEAPTVATLAQAIEQTHPDLRVPVRVVLSKSGAGPMQSLARSQGNDTTVDDFLDHCIHSLFEEQVARTPDAVALVFENRALTYAEVNARANQLAHALRARGVGPEVLVGVLAERSPEMVVALLAVLKAGGAYVPLDPSYPQRRLAHMLEDAQLAVTLVQPHLLTALPASAAHTVLLDDSWTSFASESTENPPLACAPRNLAYVIFTSGSTGRPKGVMNEHGGVCNLLLWLCREYALSSDDRVLQKTPFSFDVSVWEFFCPLIVGAQLVIAQPGGHRDSAYLARLIRDSGITTLNFVPSMLRMFMETHGFEACRALKRVFCGGEALPPDLLERFFARFPGLELHNHYGPTEAAVYATFWACQPDREDRRVPIGRPLPNTRTYILDARGQPVPIGVSGELCIGGVQVARGYLNRPELTAERFVVDPFSPEPGARMYRTGDLARYLPDGNIDFLGRIDQQVKLRGFRIELGEIETVLMRLPQLREAVAVLREDTPGDPRLVAYVVPALAMPSPADLRSALKEQLPEHMIPAVFLPVAAMPLTASGKVDRKALPVPPHAQHEPADRDIATRNALEALVTQIWCEVLTRSAIGIDDDFFDLGGHSLLAIRVASRIQSALHIEVPGRTLFEATTVAKLCAAIARDHPGLQVPEAPPGSVAVPHRRLESAPLQRRAAPDSNAAAPLSGPSAAPLSCAQEGLWFFEEMTGPSGTYNIAHALRLVGPLQVEALERAVHSLVRRHDSLRTAFVSSHGVTVQSVRPLDEVTRSLQLSAMALEGGTLAEVLRAAAAEPFDLARAPLLRVRLWRTGEHEHALLLVVHHIVSDGWSMGILARELGALYDASCAGQPDPLAPLPRQFIDYTEWQRQRLSEPGGMRDLAYWRAQLAGLEPLQLHTDRARPPRSSHRGARRRVEISPANLAELKALARRENATLFMVLLAAFQVLLMRHSGQHDVAVGSPVAGRHRTEFEGLIGYFVNVLVLRSDLSGNPSFTELLSRVRLTCLQAYEHQEQPFDRLVAELSPDRDLGRNPLYQIAFVLQNTPPGTLTLGDLRSEPLAVDSSAAKFDLSLSLGEEGGYLRGTLEYSTQLFDAASVDRLISHFGTLLEAIVATPGTRIEQLPLMTALERELLLGWSGSARIDARQPNLHQLFEAQALRHPGAVAIAMGESSLRYAELNARANRLAHHLRALGVGPDVLVGMCLQRGPQMIVAVLAILKAGGAYVPLDPDYPSERLAFMLADTAAPVLIIEQALRGQLPDTQAHVLSIDGDTQAFALHPDSNPSALAHADHLAYVIYTSGSTGTPKGVMVSHRAVARLVIDTDYVQLGPDDVVAQASNSSFDAATFEIWGALLNGATLVIVPRDVLLSGTALAREIAARRITTLFLTTSLFNEHASNSPGMFSSLQQLLFGGEAVNTAAVQRVLESTPPRRLLNVYGPTETTTFATWFEVPMTSAVPSARTPIGRPIANTRCRVLDAQLEPVPVGIVGELYIGGPGLARGYLNRPDLTAERFIDDPWLPGERLYRTGDLVRYLPDGHLDCMGRADRQVKLRGFRIELGEIEAALVACAGVRQCVVQLGEGAAATARLVAYVVTPDGVADSCALAAELKQRLPDFMIPSAIVTLPALPLTPNGKLDHKALPQPAFQEPGQAPMAGGSNPARDSAFVAPETPLEQTLAATWSQVLGVQPIGVHDDFFELGGHSLLAVRLLRELDKVLGTALHVTTLFQAPTIRQLAARIEQQQIVPSSCVVEMQPLGERRALFGIAGFGGGVSRFRTLAGVLNENRPLYLLDTALFNSEPEDFSLEDLARRMIKDMREQQPEGPYHLIGYSLGGNIAFEIGRQLRAQGVEVGLLALLDSGVPGYPPRASFARRVLAHIRHGLALGPAHAVRYVGQRAWRLRKYVISLRPQLFGELPVTLMPLGDQLSVSDDAVGRAWSRYVPRRYPGQVLLIRAEVRPQHPPGVVDNDPELGWGTFVGGGLRLESMPCGHQELMDPEHAGALASILHKHLEWFEASQRPDGEIAPDV